MFQKKERGMAEYILPVMLISMVCLIALLSYRLRVIKLTQIYVEDGLVSANLACSIVDLQEYGQSNEIRIPDFDQAYEIYWEALRANLNLTAAGEPKDQKLISGPVSVEEFTIYQVSGDDVVQICRTQAQTNSHTYPGGKGSLETPDGKRIESTTVYSRIGFDIRGYGNERFYVQKENSVDIVDE